MDFSYSLEWLMTYGWSESRLPLERTAGFSVGMTDGKKGRGRFGPPEPTPSPLFVGFRKDDDGSIRGAGSFFTVSSVASSR